jgi:lipid II:glycine glycyltransferase (peptidoglycan interpeptide bridge formation enzyme)
MDKSFLQSPAWGEVQTSYGRKIKWLGSTLAIQYPLPFQQHYWFIPQGDYVAGLADGAVFVRFEPQLTPTLGRKVNDVHPSHTLITPLLSPDIMLKNMKQKCRYNIHLAEKKDILIKSDTDSETFYNVLVKTSYKQSIRLHPKPYYETMYEVLKKHHMVKIYTAYYQDKPIATGLFIYHGDTVTYLHGGSDYNYRSMMAPYLLHWQVMQAAYQDKFAYYDWFGIAPDNQLKHPFAGITRFKLDFGGEIISRPGTFEQPLRPLWYNAYSIMKHLWI